MRVAIFGGTFDPFHHAHHSVISAALDSNLIDKVLVVPAGDPWQKGSVVASPSDRLEMARLATDGMAGVEVSDIEVRREGPSYAIDTVNELIEIDSEDSFYWIIGSDAFSQLPSWKRIGELAGLITFLVVSRPGNPVHTEVDVNFELLPMIESHISSTKIRQDLAVGLTPQGLHPSVLHFIKTHRLYVEG